MPAIRIRHVCDLTYERFPHRKVKAPRIANELLTSIAISSLFAMRHANYYTTLEKHTMKKKILALALVLGGAMSATAVSAQDVNGFFLQGKLGSASSSSNDFDDEVTSFQFNGGYRWGAFGIEAGYVDFGGFEGEDRNFDLDADINGFTLGGNFRTSFSDSWFFGARAGAFFWEADADTVVPSSTSPTSFLVVRRGEDSTDFYAGVSVGYDFNEQFSVGLSYDYFGPESNEVSLETNVLSLMGEARF